MPIVIALIVLALALAYLAYRHRAALANFFLLPTPPPAEATPPSPAPPESSKLERLSAEAMRIYEEVGESWWAEVWGPKHPDPPYDWAKDPIPRAVVGSGRGRLL